MEATIGAVTETQDQVPVAGAPQREAAANSADAIRQVAADFHRIAAQMRRNRQEQPSALSATPS